MRQVPARWTGGLALSGLLALGGCVDMLTGAPPGVSRTWRGTTTAGPAVLPECAPQRVEVALYDHPIYVPAQIQGRAYPLVEPEGYGARLTDAVTTWWAWGHMYPNRTVQFETRRQRPVYFRAMPYALWRGVMVEDDRILLDESGSPCGRKLVLTRG